MGATMDLQDSNRMVAAILAAGMLHHTRQKYMDNHAAPDAADAVTTYAQCLYLLRQRQKPDASHSGHEYY